MAKATNFAISSKWPYIWNNYLIDTEKCLPFISVFCNKVEDKLLESENETFYF